MKLWLLQPAEGLDPKDDPWVPWYDKTHGFVVRAQTESDARKLANCNGGDETGAVRHIVYRTGGDPWLDPKYSTCVELKAKGESCVILEDHRSA